MNKKTIKDYRTRKKILVTSALPYVNNVPHLGNLIGAVLSADVFARFHRSLGNKTIYICGSDEHGTTTEIKAMEEKLTPKELCDKYYKIHKEIYEWFNISFDIFGRTSHETQTELTQKIFFDLYKNGFIEEDYLEQTYDEKEKKFLADRFVEGTCPYCGYEKARGDQCDSCGRILNPKDLINPVSKLSGTKPVIKKVKHLFINLDKLQPELEKWVSKRSKEGNWSQNAIRITKAWFKEGLNKRCITRDLEWGVKVPLKGWENKVFYVWFDAPIGYISITKQLLGEKYKEWWQKPEEVLLYQFMGKDNIPFHTIIFPASLIGTRKEWTLVYHLSSTEYLQYEGGKFSKSNHTGVFGDDAEKTGIPADVFRYYLLINRPENSDTTFSWDDFAEKLNNELVANLGNLVNRTTTFINKYLGGKITEKPELEKEDEEFWEEIKEKELEVTKLIAETQLKEALKKIMEISKTGNAYFQKNEPWKTIKEKPEKARTTLYLLANLCKDLAIMTEPYMPTTSEKIKRQLNINKKEATWINLGELSLKGKGINKQELLFKKIMPEEIKKLKETFNGSNKKKTNKKEEKEKNKEEKQDPEKIFSKLDLRVARITSVKKHPSADKLYIEEIDVGELGKRQIVSGLVPYYKEEELIGKKIIIIANLKPAKLRGEISQGMLLAAENKEGRVGLILAQESKPGSKIIIKETKQEPEEQLKAEEFFKIKLESKKEGVFLKEKELKTEEGESLKSDKEIYGPIR